LPELLGLKRKVKYFMASLSFIEPIREMMQPVKGLRSSLATDLAIDLGSSSTRIYAPGRGIVLNEPSVIAIDNRTNQIMIAGREAKIAIGREPQTVSIIRPIRDGVIADFDAAQKMLTHFMRIAIGRHRFFNPRVLICAPGELTPVERRALEDATYRAGAKRVEIVEAPIAAASGAGYDETSGETFMSVDIGGGTTNIAVLSCGGAVHLSTLRMGGGTIDRAICEYLRYKRGIEAGQLTVETIKRELASVEESPVDESFEVRGRNAASGMPEQILVTRKEIRKAVGPVVDEIIRSVRNAMEELPPEVSADLLEAGIVLSGGVAQLPGLRKRLEQAASIKVRVADNPELTVALGAGRLLKRDERMLKPNSVVEERGDDYAPARAA
jgi:rod shape-determining protein MreB